MSRSIRNTSSLSFALAVIALLGGTHNPASAQTALSGNQIVQTMGSAARAAPPGLTAALIRQAVQQHMIDNPGLILPVAYAHLED